jgi:hypothetical protein
LRRLGCIRVVALLALVLTLTGCDSLRRLSGLSRTPPDEFTVLSRAPLDLPPDYTLRPPQGGALRPQETAPTDQARRTVFRANERDTSLLAGRANRSTGELALLKQAGAGTAEPNIRQLVNQENTKLLAADRSFVDKLIFWQKPAEPGVVVDAEKEAHRLRENAALGKPANEGETAIIERKQKGFLEGIF